MGLEQEQRERSKEEEEGLGARPLILFIISMYGDLTQTIWVLTAILREGGPNDWPPLFTHIGSETQRNPAIARGCRHLPRAGHRPAAGPGRPHRPPASQPHSPCLNDPGESGAL